VLQEPVYEHALLLHVTPLAFATLVAQLVPQAPQLPMSDERSLSQPS
jgi:hypothetical protein